MTDVTFGVSDRWLGTQVGTNVTATLALGFFFLTAAHYLHGFQVSLLRVKIRNSISNNNPITKQKYLIPKNAAYIIILLHK